MFELMVESWLNAIPLWVYVVVVLLAVATAFYLFSPVLVPLWNITPRWVKIAVGVLLAIGSAFVSGRYRGRKTEKELEKKRDEQAVQRREEIHHDVEKLDRPDVDKRLDKWMRRDE